ncbi:class I SAM-dependent methyltransferase [Kitasatospora viridis]|nr:class I SAM-dependent methyltransferase [Kitasatospora viridis]
MPAVDVRTYGTPAAAAFQASRHVTEEGLTDWRDAVGRALGTPPTGPILDLGSGTGLWATLFTRWFGVDVLAVEPSAAMRELSMHPGVMAGDAARIPLEDESVSAVWLSTVIHHVPDLEAAALEIRRVLKPGAPVLVRAAFPGRCGDLTLCEFFPQTLAVMDGYPSVETVRAAFRSAGFGFESLAAVPEVFAQSLSEYADRLDRYAFTPLRFLTDEEYEAGLARLRQAARLESGPVIDKLDLLVLR